jgi:hypothetical protein
MAATEIKVQMQQRRDTAAGWTSADPTLLAGELGFETDTNKIKIGDGSTAWSSLSYIPAFAISAHPLATADIADDAINGDKLANDITIANDLTVTNNLTVNGTTTTINSTTLQVDDKNIELGTVATPTDATADGGGITLKGSTDHTILWTDSTDSWDFSEHLNIASAKEFRIAGTKVLDATSLGSAVVSSSLTSVGTLSSLTVSGDLTVDTTTLHVDSSNNRVGIGTTSPSSKLVVEDDTFIYFDLNRTGAASGLCRLANSGNVLDISNNVNGVTFSTGSTPSEVVRIDSNGRMGIGTTSAQRSIHVNQSSPVIRLQDSDGTDQYSDFINSGGNLFIDSRNNTSNGSIIFRGYSAAEYARISNVGNLLLGGTVNPLSATKAFAIFNGTAPTASVADGVVLYAEDVSGSSELKVRDEDGNVTTLSPHNFDLIPEGPSEDMAWSYYSEKDGKRINVDMLKAIRILEQLSGEQLVFSS